MMLSSKKLNSHYIVLENLAVQVAIHLYVHGLGITRSECIGYTYANSYATIATDKKSEFATSYS